MLNINGTKVYSNRAALNELARLAALVPHGHDIVEVGVFRGGSLRVIAETALAHHVHGIDTWGLEGAYQSGSEDPAKYGIRNLDHARRHCAGLTNITFIRDFSTHAAATYSGGPIGMWYLDAEHTYDAVHADWDAWAPLLEPGCIVAFDDYRPTHQGVMDAVNEIVTNGHLAPLTVIGDRLAVTRTPL